MTEDEEAMTLLTEDRADAQLPPDMETRLTETLALGLAYAAAPDDVEISLSLVTPDEIRSLNNTYRAQDRETDVLSFPFYEPWEIQQWIAQSGKGGAGRGGATSSGATPSSATLSGAAPSGAMPSSAAPSGATPSSVTLNGAAPSGAAIGKTAREEIALGDIVICPEAAKTQAAAYGHSYLRELAFLAVHGLLHLLGYDHENAEDEQTMMSAQEAILQKAGIGRTDDRYAEAQTTQTEPDTPTRIKSL